MSEEYSVGYSEGYQAGWNAAMDATPPAQPAPVQPLTWLKTIETPGGFGKFVEAKPNEKGAKPVYLMPPAAQPAPVQDTEAHYKGVVEGVQKLFDDKRAQPAVPDAITDDSESSEYRTGWNDCRQAMMEMKP
jgi:hypothetical protein